MKHKQEFRVGFERFKVLQWLLLARVFQFGGHPFFDCFTQVAQKHYFLDLSYPWTSCWGGLFCSETCFCCDCIQSLNIQTTTKIWNDLGTTGKTSILSCCKDVIQSIWAARDFVWSVYLSINLVVPTHPALTPPITQCAWPESTHQLLELLTVKNDRESKATVFFTACTAKQNKKIKTELERATKKEKRAGSSGGETRVNIGVAVKRSSTEGVELLKTDAM